MQKMAIQGFQQGTVQVAPGRGMYRPKKEKKERESRKLHSRLLSLFDCSATSPIQQSSVLRDDCRMMRSSDTVC